MVTEEARELHVDADGEDWRLAGPGAVAFGLVSEYLGYLADRRYSPRTVRSYAFDLLHFCRWLSADGTALEAVTTDTLLRFLAACREEVLPGQRGGNVVVLRSAGPQGTRRRRSTAGWRRSRDCSRSGPCATPTR
jgi:hypothetical protein